jgi:hypothetical protein
MLRKNLREKDKRLNVRKTKKSVEIILSKMIIRYILKKDRIIDQLFIYDFNSRSYLLEPGERKKRWLLGHVFILIDVLHSFYLSLKEKR